MVFALPFLYTSKTKAATNVQPRMRRASAAAARSGRIGGTSTERGDGSGAWAEEVKPTTSGTSPRHVGSGEEGAELFLLGACLGRDPDGQDESDLIHKVREIVDQIQNVRVHLAQQVAEEVAQGVYGPADGDNDTHGVEGALHVLVRLLPGRLARRTHENLEEDEAPAPM